MRSYHSGSKACTVPTRGDFHAVPHCWDHRHLCPEPPLGVAHRPGTAAGRSRPASCVLSRSPIPSPRRSGKGSVTSVMWRGTTFVLSTGLPRTSTSGCPSWRPTWCSSRWTSSSPADPERPGAAQQATTTIPIIMALQWRRSRGDRARGEPRPTGRERHRLEQHVGGVRGQAAGTAHRSRAGP